MPNNNKNKATSERLTTQVVIRISDELKEALRVEGEKLGLSPASVARQLIEKKLLGTVKSSGVTRGRKPDATSKAAIAAVKKATKDKARNKAAEKAAA